MEHCIKQGFLQYNIPWVEQSELVTALLAINTWAEKINAMKYPNLMRSESLMNGLMRWYYLKADSFLLNSRFIR